MEYECGSARVVCFSLFFFIVFFLPLEEAIEAATLTGGPNWCALLRVADGAVILRH